jgi:hypothetical protein
MLTDVLIAEMEKVKKNDAIIIEFRMQTGIRTRVFKKSKNSHHQFPILKYFCALTNKKVYSA